jgi:hypothetical protein
MPFISNIPCLLLRVNVTSAESVAFTKEIVASEIPCLAAVSINFPFMLPSAFCARTTAEPKRHKTVSAATFLIISEYSTNLDVLIKKSLRHWPNWAKKMRQELQNLGIGNSPGKEPQYFAESPGTVVFFQYKIRLSFGSCSELMRSVVRLKIALTEKRKAAQIGGFVVIIA